MKAEDFAKIAEAKQQATFKKYPWNDLGVTAADVEIFKVGIKKVVEQINPQIESFIQSPKMPNEMSLCIKVWWQAQLKEWGVALDSTAKEG